MPRGKKLEKSQIEEIKQLKEEYPDISNVKIARFCGVSDYTVSKVLQGYYDEKPKPEKPAPVRKTAARKPAPKKFNSAKPLKLRVRVSSGAQKKAQDVPTAPKKTKPAKTGSGAARKGK